MIIETIEECVKTTMAIIITVIIINSMCPKKSFFKQRHQELQLQTFKWAQVVKKQSHGFQYSS